MTDHSTIIDAMPAGEKIDRLVARVIGLKLGRYYCLDCKEYLFPEDTLDNETRCKTCKCSNINALESEQFCPSTDPIAFMRAWDFCATKTILADMKIYICPTQAQSTEICGIDFRPNIILTSVWWGFPSDPIYSVESYGDNLQHAFCKLFLKWGVVAGKLTKEDIENV